MFDHNTMLEILLKDYGRRFLQKKNRNRFADQISSYF